MGFKIMYALQFNLSLDPWSYRFFPFEIGFFMLGSMAYQMYHYLKPKPVPSYIGYVLLASCITGVFIINLIPVPTNFKNLIFYTLIFYSIPFIVFQCQENKGNRAKNKSIKNQIFKNSLATSYYYNSNGFQNHVCSSV